ncbi:MAG: DUF5813 family protein [Haloarculaceae archaeon]
MTDEEEIERAFERRDAYERDGDGFAVTTTAFEGQVTVTALDDWQAEYTVEVAAPTLSAATTEEVGPAVEDGWFETLELRLEDAPKTTRVAVDLDGYDLREQGEEVVVEYRFTHGNPATAADVAKAFVEYVEGTYVEGIVPGYEYEGPVADLVSEAATDDGTTGGTPL